MKIGFFKAVVVCSKKWEKDGKKFNTIEFSIFGLGSTKFTVDEKLVPDLIDGSMVKFELELGIRDGRFYVKPNWESLEL